MERRFIGNADAGVTVETRADGKEVITGYASVFYDGSQGTEFELYASTVERVLPTAFDRAVAQRDDARALFNHNPDNLLGRLSANTLRLSVDNRGLRYEIDPPDTQVARDVVAMIKRGDLSGSSFAFEVTDEAWVKESGKRIRQIRGVKLYDVGPVTYPAYEATSAGMRSLIAADDLEAVKAAADALDARLAEIASRAKIVDEWNKT